MTATTRTAWLATAIVVLLPIAEPFSGNTETVRAASSAARIIVRARPGVSRQTLRTGLAARGLVLGAGIPHTRLFTVRANGRTPATAIRSLAHSALVAEATLDYVRQASAVPNDPYFASGQTYLNTIRMREAWDLGHGSATVIVAVVDTGVTPVADLFGRVLPGHNFVLDDGDTSPDDQVVGDEDDARDNSVIGHGTLVAGIVAATTDNGLGIAGVAGEARVLPVKVLNAHGAGTDYQIAAGIVWAVDHGASIVNLSLRAFAPGTALCDTVTYAISKGTLVIAAAGNDGEGVPMYPAACPGVVAVSATDTNGDFASFSNYGPWVSIAAPGIQITSTRNDNRIGAESGTSLASPIVAGVAALVKAQHPDWTPAQITTRLEESASDRGPVGIDPYYGHGLLDAYRALGGPAQSTVIRSRDALEPNDAPSQKTLLTASASGTIAPEGDVDWYAVQARSRGALAFRVGGLALNTHVGPNFNPVLKVYDHNLHLLATKDAASYGQGERVTVQVAAGRYYLRVANKGGAQSPGGYSVAVTRVRSPE
jgi:subtilisin family serine protease